MPLNEAGGYRRSNLTKEQRREAEAVIYGLAAQQKAMSFLGQLSEEEIERMRDIVAQHDSQNKGGMKEFDLNNPPKLPYVYQPYPCIMYHHGKRKTQKAHSAEEAEAAIDAGWSREPFLPEHQESDLAPEVTAEVAELDRQARTPKKK